MFNRLSRLAPAKKQIRQRGLSLLEVIIATAILAGSGMVLFSIIGMGSKYAMRAEELTYAHHFAQSVLDEWQAAPSAIGTEQSGTIEETPDWSYRIESQLLEDQSLCLVQVEISRSTPSRPNTTNGEPIYKLSRWVRVPLDSSNTKGNL